ncbi:hypothetical protein DMN91_012183 [Ooceraea biroi]|uniref:Peroxisomal multifunctional enzyme type 2 n=1 Tax=Ooceraea biroi TaxID=2015173 RepID=A0A026WES8_OOCBI|nr:peroxisomal multifunctional enzyme type 2 [Ooceraea biroi]EZA54463.1 Peroxisomal multifunctional enzyme type [Ooceraea biroi]RLU15189.1 hypothetical protein DMN91_012183 [Ooceraea biroi]
MSELRFDNRVVVVTGAGAGLGRAYALLFASRGASVVVNDLGGSRHGDGSSTKSADAVVAEIRRNGGKAVADYNSVLQGDKIVQTAIDAYGRVDVVINNAGILRDTSFAKMTMEQWDAIYDVHLKGAMITTKAAWPYFYKQNYGRIIFTSSNSGLYGNFGQTNYSTAKLGLVGLANTLALEGKKRNIYTNVIVPTAASRLTEDVLPPDFFEHMKPELIAPVVFWLCHENCTENGSIIESALGWAGKCHLVRSTGCILRQDLSADVTPEAVKENWSQIINMKKAKRCNTIHDATQELMYVFDSLSTPDSLSSTVVSSSSEEENIMISRYNNRDVILYALGVGATVAEADDLRYLYENHDNFAILPTFFTTYGPMGCIETSVLQTALPNIEFSLAQILHGEQYLEVLKPLPVEATLETRFKVQDVMDKGKGVVVLVQHDTYNGATEEKLSTGQISVFITGVGGYGGKRSSDHIIPTVQPPARKPDVVYEQKTSVDQAALYRLSGDYNPLHIDPNFSAIAGHRIPILHGLCSLGFSTRHVIKTFAGGDPHLFKCLKVRFVKPVIPGDTLRTEMWRNGKRIHFRTSTDSTKDVIAGAYIDLLEVVEPMLKANRCSASVDLQSDAVFVAIGEHVKTNPEKVKKVNGIFLYNITVDGKVASEWTLDLKNAEVHKGKPKSGKADTTLTIDDKDMVEIALGKLNPQTAFMRGKLKITGNIMLTQKLKGLMEMNNAKL